MNNFWTNFIDPPKGIGYGVFTLGHLLLVLCSLLLVTIIVTTYKKSDKSRRIRIRRTIAAVLVASDCIKFPLMYFQGVDIIQYLPLEVCSFAVLAIILDSIWTENKFFPEMLVTIFLPGAIMQHVSPTTAALPIFNFYTIHQFLFHGLIIAYVMARFLNGEIHLTYKGVWASVGKICVLAAFDYTANLLLHTDFMFLMHPDGNFLLSIIEGFTGKGFPYTLGLVAFTIVMIHVFFAIFKVVEILFINSAPTRCKNGIC